MENSDFRQLLVKWYDRPLFQSLQNHPDFSKMMESFPLHPFVSRDTHPCRAHSRHDRVSARGNDPVVRQQATTWVGGSVNDRRLENNPIELAKVLRNMGTGNMLNLWKRLAENQIPLLLLVGEYDPKFKAINAEMAGLCEMAQLAIASKADHNIHLENPREWVKQVRFFCGRTLPI
ncbi:MAG: hypothetical protein GDA56_03805 [Hormoscilla sp. GM7CHS1pb]|nr:hypothetical protein [Hormoscilla sp. GM7CHS1pb]